MRGNPGMAKLLLEKPAPVDMKDEDRSSSLLSDALHADQHGTELVSLLLSHGALIGVMKRTALLQAATALGEDEIGLMVAAQVHGGALVLRGQGRGAPETIRAL
jgi:hypothetical protein